MFKINQISAIDFIEIFNNNQNNPDVVFIDVRTKDEFDFSRIEGFIHIPIQDISANPNLLQKYSNKKVYFLCRSGVRSDTACQFAGDFNIDCYNITGGILALNAEINKS